MNNFISVVICTHNPVAATLSRTLSALQSQTLAFNYWELIIVDNNSNPPLIVDIDWHSHNQIVVEPKPGLTNARLKGFNTAKGDLIVLVDDDNILNPDYLERARQIFNDDKTLGAAGGKSMPLFEQSPPAWLKEFYGSLALRDLGETVIKASWEHKYPVGAPIGAGMVILKEALALYSEKKPTITDRVGKSLSSGGDNEIVIEVLKSGWAVGYFPALVISHIIPVQRMQVKYMARLINNTNKSWVQLLDKHQINPWHKIPGWTVPLRKLKSFFVNKAWQNEPNYINWRGACGLFDGLASVNQK